MSKRTYNIYTLVYRNKIGVWSDLQGFGCFEEDARAGATEWTAKGVAVALRIDTYVFSKNLQPPVKSAQVTI